MDEVSVDGKSYISSKKAAELSSYSQDYIGQLVRAGHVDAQRIGGLWYVSMDSLNEYKNQSEVAKPETPKYEPKAEPESLIMLDGKDYLSASRAAKLTGYNQDYVGQLARSSQILARQIGNRWYIDREAILAHKNAKDTLLASVQAESVGLMRPGQAVKPDAQKLMTYAADTRDLMPMIAEREKAEGVKWDAFEKGEADTEEEIRIPIRVLKQDPFPKKSEYYTMSRPQRSVAIPGKTIFKASYAAAVLTIVIVLSIGAASLKDQAIYAGGVTAVHDAMPAGVTASLTHLSDALAAIFKKELVYIRE